MYTIVTHTAERRCSQFKLSRRFMVLGYLRFASYTSVVAAELRS